MKLERLQAESSGRPFPVHADLAERLVAAHAPGSVAGVGERDPTVAHALATCAGYAYADTATVATMLDRLGLQSNACVRVTQTVDAMFVFSTAFLVQSRCGRIVVLCYRGTEAMNLGNWLGDVDVDEEKLRLGGAPLHVHAGFYRNVRATLWTVIEELTHALRGRPLAEPSATAKRRAAARYSLGAHLPHHYIAALRPKDRITEFGDRE